MSAVLITGASGALGPHLLAELLRSGNHDRIIAVVRPGRRWAEKLGALQGAIVALAPEQVEAVTLDRLTPVAGDICRADLGLGGGDLSRLLRDVEVVIHAAAMTRFAAPESDLHDSNVQGTRHVLELARRCPHLRQFLLVSTACVAGTATGSIAEQLNGGRRGFVNAYEQTKCQAEHLAAAAPLPVRIARLSTCIGDDRTGHVHRFGAIHHLLRWLVRGLLPMMPGADDPRVDLIATDVGARWLARAAGRPVEGLEVCHVAAGDRAIRLRELLECAVGHLRSTAPEWQRGQVEPPAIVDAETFRLFERAVADTGDALLTRVLEAARSFLPALQYPKVYQTARAERVWGGPLPLSDWRSTLGKVIEFGRAHQWRHRLAQARHV